ncbi:hypothetical protein [Paracoccus sp. SY]|uniref:hypothetical protein n=1 Tax=Paracoccus sp. SY TaxID=1330255 RepID=UPI001304E1BC|nr:hypothetical protein [Paracoccus sp. SY]
MTKATIWLVLISKDIVRERKVVGDAANTQRLHIGKATVRENNAAGCEEDHHASEKLYRLLGKPAVKAVCSDRANGRKALPYVMRFSCFTDRDLCRW